MLQLWQTPLINYNFLIHPLMLWAANTDQDGNRNRLLCRHGRSHLPLGLPASLASGNSLPTPLDSNKIVNQGTTPTSYKMANMDSGAQSLALDWEDHTTQVSQSEYFSGIDMDEGEKGQYFLSGIPAMRKRQA